jgi:hypothetical protein
MRENVLIRIVDVKKHRWVRLGNVNFFLRRREQIAVVGSENFDDQIRDGVRWGIHGLTLPLANH